MDLLDFRPGIAVLNVEGPLAHEMFKDEAGETPRWQRVHPKRATRPSPDHAVHSRRNDRPEEIRIKDSERDGDHRLPLALGLAARTGTECNTAIQIRRFLPTGLLVRSEAERSQFQNRELALGVLRSKLVEMQSSQREASTRSGSTQQPEKTHHCLPARRPSTTSLGSSGSLTLLAASGGKVRQEGHSFVPSSSARGWSPTRCFGNLVFQQTKAFPHRRIPRPRSHPRGQIEVNDLIHAKESSSTSGPSPKRKCLLALILTFKQKPNSFISCRARNLGT